MKSADLQAMLDVNLFGALHVMQQAVNVMREQGRGHIVNVASLAGRRGFSPLGGYCATKFGLIGLTEALRTELVGERIHVSIVLPGVVDTAMVSAVNETPEAGGIWPQALNMPPSWVVWSIFLAHSIQARRDRRAAGHFACSRSSRRSRREPPTHCCAGPPTLPSASAGPTALDDCTGTRMQFENLTIECSDCVATLWLDRPEKMNALHRALWKSIPDAVASLDADPGVRVIVLAGRGRAFCAGIDLVDHAAAMAGGGSLSGQGDSAVGKRLALLADIRRYQDTCSSLANTNKPVIAAVHGSCIGAGMDLITACDIRLASADAIFSVRETRIAMVADVGTLQRLPRVIGDGPARELIFTGRDIDASRALAIGLVNEVLADVGSLHVRALALAREIAANSPLAVQGSKQVLGHAARREVDAGLDYVALWNAAFLHSEDLAEAMTAFMQRRKPDFNGK